MPGDIPDSPLRGDIAVAPKAGYRWPIKNWHFFDDLISALSKQYTVNVLPKRTTLLEHIADIKQHRFVISADSLPMHLAMGLGIPGVAIFTCTSPWEIYDYDLLRKVISQKLDRYWYSREYHKDAVTCIPFQQVHSVVTETLTAYNIHSEVFK
jgi:ADP-heptose:LPS heptosyltransferase